MHNNFYIIDFDSTLVSVETIDELARYHLDDVQIKIFEDITKHGMEGKISFPESISKRLAMLNSNKQIVEKVSKKIPDAITKSVLKNLDFFQKNVDNLIVISGGFEELLFPTIDLLGIKRENVFCHKFVFSENGNILGHDPNTLMAKYKGKKGVVENIEHKFPIFKNRIILGDGFTDLEIRQAGLANVFIAFTENISRLNITEEADFIAKDFNDFLNFVSQLK